MSGAELGAKIYGAELDAIRSGAEPLAGRLPVARSSAPDTVAPSSAPLTLAPSQGSISGILSVRGLFERNFRKKGQKVKNSDDIHTCILGVLTCTLYYVMGLIFISFAHLL